MQRVDLMEHDPLQVRNMRRHNVDGHESTVLRLDGQSAIAKAIRRSGIKLENAPEDGGIEFHPRESRMDIPKRTWSHQRGEITMQAAHYAAKGCMLQQGDPESKHEELASTVGATLIAHRMAAKAGREWRGPEQPWTLKAAGALLQKEPEVLEQIIEKWRRVEARMTPGNADWTLLDIKERLENHVAAKLLDDRENGDRKGARELDELIAALETEPLQAEENQLRNKHYQQHIQGRVARAEREGSHPEQGPVKPPSAHEHVPARPATHTPKADPTERGLQR